MKKVIALLCLLALLVSLCACASSNFAKANTLYNRGSYEEAIVLFESLGDYENSEEMILACRYEMARKLISLQEYEAAIAAFEELGDYSDSAERVADCRYALAVSRYDAGDYEGALELFSLLEDYEGDEDYMGKITWHRFRNQLGTEGPTEVSVPIEGGYRYTVTLSQENDYIQAVYHLDLGNVDTTLTALFSQGSSSAALVGSSSVAYEDALIKEACSGAWTLSSYQKGDSLEWREYECTGTQIGGIPLEEGTTGILFDPATALERLVTGLERALREMDAELDLQDFGFLLLEE